MATKQFKWRTAVSGTEGKTHVFIHELGSNEFGDGTRQNPYQTLDYWNHNGTPSRVTCIGTFSCPMLNGNHSCIIEGDYYGAATFDGKGLYCIYGFTLQNMIVVNTGIEGIGRGSLSGVGRATDAGGVGFDSLVYGVAGPYCLLERCLLYMGVAGATYNATISREIYSRLKTNEGSYKLSLGKAYESTFVNNNDVTLWRKTIYGNQTLQYCIFGKQIVVVNYANTFSNCFFTSDTEFWMFKGTEYNSETDVRIIPEGSTSAERQADLISKIEAKYAEWGQTVVKATFNSCIFSDKTSYQIFVDVDRSCYNLKPGCDAVTDSGTYYGALPPAKYLPIYTDSTGIAETWDERTCGGCVCVEQDPDLTASPQPGSICVDEASVDLSGEIYSKILAIDPRELQLSGFYAFAESKFNDYAIHLNSVSRLDTQNEYSAGDSLPVGRYKVRGSIILTQTINDSVVTTVIGNGGNAVVSGTDASFADDGATSALIPYLDPNLMDVIYCRCRSVIYRTVAAGDTLYPNVTYYNNSPYDLTFRSRTIVPGESFVCMNPEDVFTCASDPTVSIAVMFDDRTGISSAERLVPAAEWIPAQLWGEYFVDKSGGVMQHDADGIPVSSGNYLAFQTTSNGGYSDRMHKSILNQKYIQLAVFVNRFNSEVE